MIQVGGGGRASHFFFHLWCGLAQSRSFSPLGVLSIIQDCRNAKKGTELLIRCQALADQQQQQEQPPQQPQPQQQQQTQPQRFTCQGPQPQRLKGLGPQPEQLKCRGPQPQRLTSQQQPNRETKTVVWNVVCSTISFTATHPITFSISSLASSSTSVRSTSRSFIITSRSASGTR